MAYQIDKSTGDIVISGFEQGIFPSPHKGIANMQAVNTSTETGEVMCSYARVQQSQTGTSSSVGSFSPLDSTHLTPTLTGGLRAGVWINVSSTSISGLSTGNYYVLSSASGFTSVQLSSSYNGAAITGLGLTGTAAFGLLVGMGQPVASATETYSTGTAFQYRYYIMDNQGAVWVYDTATSGVTAGLTWFLPDPSINYYNSATPTGMAFYNGWLHVFAGNTIWCKSTVQLGGTPGWVSFATGLMTSQITSPNPHFAFVGHQGRLYYTDGTFLGSIFANSSLLSGIANIQSYASYTTSSGSSGHNGVVSAVIGGSIPTLGGGSTASVPAVFFSTGTLGTNLTTGTIYWITYSLGAGTAGTFTVSATNGGSAIDINSGAVGTQYFNTYFPTSTSGKGTITFTPENVDLPFFETCQSIAETDNIVVIGCKSNTLYIWDQIAPTPTDIVFLPENNAVKLIAVNNMVYAFAGSKGNIYVTNGSTAAPVITVPDYCAGVPGTQASYVEPYFSWGDVMYLRGRLYFSILDQTSTKAGNCGGVWSFIPTENQFIQQDQGLSLRMENQSSYGTYNGVSTVLLGSQNQAGLGPQYWSGWYSSISSPLYGIDFTSATPSTSAVIETDLIPTGTILNKKTFKQVEYKLSAPLVAGETVSGSFRQNSTDAWTPLNAFVVESTASLSGQVSVNFQAGTSLGQWLQLQLMLNPNTSTSSSFVRLSEIRIR